MKQIVASVLAASLLVAQQPPPAQQQQAGPPLVLNLPNASLTEVIDILARQLKINYILDPRVKGNVTVHTYGEVRGAEVRGLLETILRVNGFAMVQVGDRLAWDRPIVVDKHSVGGLPGNRTVGPGRRDLRGRTGLARAGGDAGRPASRSPDRPDRPGDAPGGG